MQWKLSLEIICMCHKADYAARVSLTLLYAVYVEGHNPDSS